MSNPTTIEKDVIHNNSNHHLDSPVSELDSNISLSIRSSNSTDSDSDIGVLPSAPQAEQQPKSFHQKKKIDSKKQQLMAVALNGQAQAKALGQEMKANNIDLYLVNRKYVPQPVIYQSSILTCVVILLALAYIWPPLILVVSFIASRLIPYCFRTNDDATERRKLYQEFRHCKQNAEWLPPEFCTTPSDIQMEEKYFINARGMCLFTSIIYSTKVPVRAVVCFTHGYSDHISFMTRVEHYRLVRSGIAIVYIEVEGHGRSDGPNGLIENWETMVDDVCEYFHAIYKTRFDGKTFFLMGESMGGALAYCVYNKIPHVFRGVVFQSPMCKISEDLLPPKIIIQLLDILIHPQSCTRCLGYLPLAPTDGTLAEKMGPNKQCLAMLDTCPTMYGRNPRLITAKTFLDATLEISASLSTFNGPFLVQHGSNDKVTDPKLSEALYEEAQSRDKTLRIYEGMWHSLVHGEFDENKEKVFVDVINWILERS